MADTNAAAANKTNRGKVRAHLADPQKNSLPGGVTIQFGAREVIRKATEDETAAPKPAANASDHHS